MIALYHTLAYHALDRLSDLARDPWTAAPPAPSSSGLGPINNLLHAIGTLIGQHQTAAIGVLIAVEEMGLPLPIPGDIFILYAGYLVATHRADYVPLALTVVVAATLGASGLYGLARRYGTAFLLKHGHLIHLDAQRLKRIERPLRRYGPLVVVCGRFVPGLRIVLSALAGSLDIGYLGFAVSVALSSAVWAVALLEVGRRLGRRVEGMLTVSPTSIIPGVLLILVVVVVALVVRHRAARHEAAQSRMSAMEQPLL